jgi:hypothetical protein
MTEAIALAAKHWKALLGAAAVLSLTVALLIARSDARHWQKRQEATQAAFDRTVADYRAAAAKARADDLVNAARVKAEQQQITQEVSNDYEARLADARKRADTLRLRINAQANPRASGAAQLPTVPVSASAALEAPGDGFSIADRLLATEQAIQLDALITWVEAQHRVNVNGPTP